MKRRNSHPLLKFLFVCTLIAGAAAALSAFYMKLKVKLQSGSCDCDDEDCDCCDGACDCCEFGEELDEESEGKNLNVDSDEVFEENSDGDEKSKKKN